jgi:Predicted metal-dependent enzyme
MKQENNACPAEKFKTMIGGQALIEGIMMRGPEKQAVVVRSPKEGLVTKVESLKKKTGVLTWPLIRGIVNFGGSMVSGVKCLMWSAEQADFDEETPADETPEQKAEREKKEKKEPSKFEAWLEKKMGSEKFMSVLIAFSLVLGFGFSLLLFFLLPIELGNLFQRLTNCGVLLQHLVEGVLRIVIFLAYMILISKLKDMRRVFSYHGAEHKTIRCYEAKLPLTVENVAKMTRKHPRCGTSFLFVVMALSIFLFTVLTAVLNAAIPSFAALRESNRLVYNLITMAVKIFVMLPLVVSVSYEINRWVGRHDNRFTRILTAPGMWFQNFTTNEPDDSMMEVAIRALELVLPEQEGADQW